MEYKYDVFVSYKRDYKSAIDKYTLQLRKMWLKDTFLPLFAFALSAEIGRDPNIFWDENELTTGDEYSDELVTNLAASRCLVAILSNPYLYDSEWCLREFCFMRYRRETTREEYPNAFLFPFLYQTTNTQHPLINGLKVTDYIKYNKVGPAFKESREFLDFQKDIELAASTIKDVILKPPSIKENWSTKEWMAKVNEMVTINRQLTLETKVTSTDVQL